MNNEFKKKDSKGNKLPEAIGDGLNENHIIVKEHLKKDDYIRFLITKQGKVAFKLACEEVPGMNESEIARGLINAFTNGKIKIN